jgi:hypothetical protein
MACGEKLLLVLEYTKAAWEFSGAVANLHAKTGVSSKEQDEQMKRIIDGRRIVMEQGRITSSNPYRLPQKH